MPTIKPERAVVRAPTTRSPPLSSGLMATLFDEITEHRALDRRQALFFVGTAPLADDGHVNVSPKGPIGSLRVLGPQSVAYLDVIGSGAETIAHLRENGRIVVMLCAFDGPPRIVRLHGTRPGRASPDDPRFDALLAGPESRTRPSRVPPGGDPSRRHADRGLVRIRRAAHARRGDARPSRPLDGQAACGPWGSRATPRSSGSAAQTHHRRPAGAALAR